MACYTLATNVLTRPVDQHHQDQLHPRSDVSESRSWVIPVDKNLRSIGLHCIIKVFYFLQLTNSSRN